MKFSSLLIFLLALAVGLIVVFIVDPLDPTTLSTPFLLGVILMAFSLRQSSILVSAIALVYIALTFYALISFRHHMNLPVSLSPHPYFWLFQRIGLFLVLSALSVYLSYYRTGTEQVLRRLRTVLGKLPVPVILSNASGEVLYANDAVTDLMAESGYSIVGRSYFDFIHIEDTKGKSIRTYFALFEGDGNGVYALEVNPFGPKNKVNAQLTCLGVGVNRILITVLQMNQVGWTAVKSMPEPGPIEQPSFKR